MIYILIYLIELLLLLVYWLLLVGVPLLIGWKLLRNWSQRGKRLFWLAAAAVWALPSMVELARDKTLDAWVADLPPAPVVELEQAATLAMINGVFDEKYGVLHFDGCPDNRWQRPLCKFEMGPETILQGHRIALKQDNGLREHGFKHRENCPLHFRFSQQWEMYSDYFMAQGICHFEQEFVAQAPVYHLAYRTDTLPGFPRTYFGQLHLSDGTSGEVLTTLTAYSVERPVYPVLWGVHWVPIFGSLTHKFTRTERFGETMEEAVQTGYPPNSLQNIAYRIGWDYRGDADAQDFADLEERFGYAPNRALPALRSNAHFPASNAIKTVCAGRFRPRMTAEVAAEIRRIAQMEKRIGNGYANGLAQQAIEGGCLFGF